MEMQQVVRFFFIIVLQVSPSNTVRT